MTSKFLIIPKIIVSFDEVGGEYEKDSWDSFPIYVGGVSCVKRAPSFNLDSKENEIKYRIKSGESIIIPFSKATGKTWEELTKPFNYEKGFAKYGVILTIHDVSEDALMIARDEIRNIIINIYGRIDSYINFENIAPNEKLNKTILEENNISLECPKEKVK